MNRLKFRAWDRFSKKFTTDEYLMCHVDGIVISTAGITSGGEAELNDGVDITQWTGLKDKNNKDIYEGDVIYAFGTMIKDIVVFGRPYNAAFCVGDYLLGVNDNTDLEIIGNIFENKSLVDGTEGN